MSTKGHTTIEYGICLGFLALLAVGSLNLLGGNISALLQQPVSGPAGAKMNELYSLIGIKGKSGGSVSGSKTSMQIQLQIDPATGQVVTTDTTGGSKNTTSVPGDQAIALMSQEFGDLANMTLANGQPLPNNIKQQILKLMQDGVSLSSAYDNATGVMDQFSAINAANTGKTSNLEQYPSSMINILGNTLGQSVQFQQDYNILTGLLTTLAKTDSSVNSTLLQPISQIAGAISAIQYDNVGKNFVNNFNVNATATSDIINVYNQNNSLQQAIPLSSLTQSLSLPSDQAASSIQQLVSSTAQNSVVGTPPTPGNPVSLSLDVTSNSSTPVSTQVSGSVSTASSTLNASSAINITQSSIQASASTTTAPTSP